MFKGFQETGEDKIILGTPWLTNKNPQIDWNERTIKIGMIASKDLDLEHSDHRKKTLKNYEKEIQGRNISDKIGKDKEATLEEEKY
jgi:hypothetical protein